MRNDRSRNLALLLALLLALFLGPKGLSDGLAPILPIVGLTAVLGYLAVRLLGRKPC